MIANIALILTVVVILSAGQLFFKLTADRLPDRLNVNALANMVIDPRFIVAIALYAGGTVLWILALKRMPLSVAYPFVAMSFVLTPILASVFLDERLSWGNAMGTLFIISGVAVIAKWGGSA